MGMSRCFRARSGRATAAALVSRGNRTGHIMYAGLLITSCSAFLGQSTVRKLHISWLRCRVVSRTIKHCCQTHIDPPRTVSATRQNNVGILYRKQRTPDGPTMRCTGRHRCGRLCRVGWLALAVSPVSYGVRPLRRQQLPCKPMLDCYRTSRDRLYG